VRQLENICHWLTVMAPAQLIEPKDLPPEIVPGAAESAASSRSMPEPVRTLELPVAPVAAAPPSTSALPSSPSSTSTWESGLEAEAMQLLLAGRHDVWEQLTKRFESRLILTALANTRGRRIEAAQKLGIGRNTITRKIQELGLDD
jgi:two-component system nitrogen regulation response regulator GlnG